ncbi:PREDICTED: exostosin-2 [Nicrophorus vespilloides]|uniref:Exostosin-2 n=1 Tax=Nicrophorus vespilloides TaxID=110193 RepID=A0ABM1M308_NICVS|nr:PREDICTED: exostosin-2 [Nicrophorus vespilloides]
MLLKIPLPNSPTCYKNFFISIILLIVIIYIYQLTTYTKVNLVYYDKVRLVNLHKLPVKLLEDSVKKPAILNKKCTYWDCFNLYRCGNTGHDRITVYVYPLKKYLDGRDASSVISKEYYRILEAVIDSKYYTANPNEACLFVPSVDTLSQDNLQTNFTTKILNNLEYWSGGENHLIYNMIAGKAPEFSPVVELDVGNAMIAGADFDTFTFRTGFDISIPIFSPVLKLAEEPEINYNRPWFLTSSQISIDPLYMQELEDLQAKTSNILILDSCYYHNYTKRCEISTNQPYDYPQILQKSTFCTIFRGERMGQTALLESMAAGCIPVIMMDSPIMPFNDVLDWKRAAIFILEDHIDNTMTVLRKITPQHVREMQKHVRFLYNTYFSSFKQIVETSLDIIQDRVFPQWGRVYDDWNVSPDDRTSNPLFLPITAPRAQGFTAVILTYDRLESLFILIEKISKVPSLMKIVVVWNHQRKAPPALSKFPQIAKPISVIRTKANKLSNRFLPYEEIETEAILSIDDDIVMLTSDELEFGYEVWREFPDRIVGFPSRTHIWDNVTKSWKYESEWTNEISMVLTGAAFYHKYWNYLYTTALPTGVKNWVDDHMNCEDIAMNFLVANITNKPPIKVAPRKKFKCPECTNNEMLSADLGHMVERSQCVDFFTKAFGRMPLQSVEFRADPVLYKDPFPEKLKRFNNIGSL